VTYVMKSQTFCWMNLKVCQGQAGQALDQCGCESYMLVKKIECLVFLNQ